MCLISIFGFAINNAHFAVHENDFPGSLGSEDVIRKISRRRNASFVLAMKMKPQAHHSLSALLTHRPIAESALLGGPPPFSSSPSKGIRLQWELQRAKSMQPAFTWCHSSYNDMYMPSGTFPTSEVTIETIIVPDEHMLSFPLVFFASSRTLEVDESKQKISAVIG